MNGIILVLGARKHQGNKSIPDQFFLALSLGCCCSAGYSVIYIYNLKYIKLNSSIPVNVINM